MPVQKESGEQREIFVWGPTRSVTLISDYLDQLLESNNGPSRYASKQWHIYCIYFDQSKTTNWREMAVESKNGGNWQ
jgi:hypothetical protein